MLALRTGLAAAFLSLAPVPLLAAQDLAKAYPVTLDWVEGAGGRSWTCGPEDVWRLKSFELSFFGELSLDFGPSVVVFGHHEHNVVWAVVLPEKDETLSARAKGDGEGIHSVFLRFHPALVGELFPRKTVRGPGDAQHAFEGKRVFAWKINASWQAQNRPVIPWRRSLVVDVETTAGRRFFMADTQKSELKYEPFFEKKALPTPAAITREDALAAFDQTWEAFDQEYPTFGLVPAVDWNELKKRWRKVAGEATTVYEAASAIGGLLKPLDDLHAWVAAGNEYVPLARRERPLNASWNGSKSLVGGFQETKKDLVWARTSDGLGYLNVYELNDQGLPEAFDLALEQLADTHGSVIDLRFNGGGDELLARAVAGRFLAEPVVYSKNRYRSGPEHDDLGPLLERVCEPRGPWRYAAPIVVLWGRRTMSSAESFALMLAQVPDATTMGDFSAGSSANRRRLELAGGIRVNLPRWLDLDPLGNPIEHVGIAPEVVLDFPPQAFTDTDDPVLAAALARLREIPEAERRSGKE